MRHFMFVALGVGLCLCCWADSIRIDGELHESVYIRESPSFYFVQMPENGAVISVRKDNIPHEGVEISDDAIFRKGLLEKWRLRSKGGAIPLESTAPPSGAVPPPNVPQKTDTAARWDSASFSQSFGQVMASAPGPDQGAPARQYVTDGHIRHFRAENMPLGQALKALLRQLDLDYSMHDGYLWVSTPERIREESLEDLEVRFYDLNDFGKTLFKIVLSQPATAQEAASGNISARFSGGFSDY